MTSPAEHYRVRNKRAIANLANKIYETCEANSNLFCNDPSGDEPSIIGPIPEYPYSVTYCQTFAEDGTSLTDRLTVTLGTKSQPQAIYDILHEGGITVNREPLSYTEALEFDPDDARNLDLYDEAKFVKGLVDVAVRHELVRNWLGENLLDYAARGKNLSDIVAQDGSVRSID